MTRILAIGDVHTEHVALAATLARFAHTVDRVFCVGDIVDGALGVAGANECIRLLRKHNIETVAGNHERWWLCGHARHDAEALPVNALDDDALEWVATRPRFITLDTSVGRAIVAHGFGADDMACVETTSLPDEATQHPEWLRMRAGKFVLHVGGHSHRRGVRRIEDGVALSGHDGTTFINAGTLHRGHSPCACVIDTTTRTVEWYPYDDGRFGVPRVERW